MCVIIINPKNKIKNTILARAALYNPHGAGFMWSENNQLHIYKNINPYKVIDRYNQLRSNFCGLIVLHFRYATHGRIDHKNTHPITIVPGKSALVHNGVIMGLGNSKYSDTYELAQLLRQGAELINLNLALGMNKIVILDSMNNLTIYNKKLFIEHNGNLYSNNCALPFYSYNMFNFKY